MIKNIYFIFITLCFTTLIKAEGSDTLFYKGDYSVIIDSIVIIGNDQTEDFIILRELTVALGDTLNPKLAEYNRERVYSLNIFNEVKLHPFQLNNVNYLLITIEESWYIYPLPFLTLKDRDWSKISYGVAVKIANFRGRNETLRGRLALGYDPSLTFSYSNPNLSRNLDLFSIFQIGLQEVSNRSTTAEELAGGDFEHKFYFAKLTFGKRFGLFHRFAVTAGYDYVETPFFIEGISASNERIDRTVILGASYNYDTRDLRQYASNGLFAFASFELKGMGINDIKYRIAYFDYREYRPIISSLVLKWRLAARLTNGKVPFYDYSYLGLGQRIRGHWDEQQEGNDLFIGSLELDYWILNDYRLNLYWIPLLPNSLLSYRVGLVWELFVDTGTTRLIGEPLALNQFSTGYGTGVSLLLLPYFTMRIEYAVNEQFKGQWIFDIGASF
ncbi:MAG: BamA/TamA family outer membrane protein [Bacteroidetes bacterium]|nr:BamA/TamA family outer membrane protein [Bacteroidota bacterium]